MEITHIGGEIVNTDKLTDVDAILMEESSNLHKLFAKYNRQLILLGEMGDSSQTLDNKGCSFFHIAHIDTPQKELGTHFNRAITRIHNFLGNMSNGNLGVGKFSAKE